MGMPGSLPVTRAGIRCRASATRSACVRVSSPTDQPVPPFPAFTASSAQAENDAKSRVRLRQLVRGQAPGLAPEPVQIGRAELVDQ